MSNVKYNVYNINSIDNIIMLHMHTSLFDHFYLSVVQVTFLIGAAFILISKKGHHSFNPILHTK